MLKQLAITLFLIGSVSAEIIPASRRITWDPGVRGGIMLNSTQSISVAMPIYKTLDFMSTRAQIQAEYDAAPSGSVLQLGYGVFEIDGTINQNRDDVVIRGKGQGNTTLKGTSGFSGAYFFKTGGDYPFNWDRYPAHNLTNVTKGATNLTSLDAHGFSVGDMVLVDMMQTGTNTIPVFSNVGGLSTATWVGRENGARCAGQLVKVLSTPTSTTFTFNPPLYYDWTNQPQAMKLDGIIQNGGLESFTIDTTDIPTTGEPIAARTCIGIFGAMNCWYYDLELRGMQYRGIWGYGGLWNTIQHCYFNGGRPIGTDNTDAYFSDKAYSIFFGPHMSANLIWDCEFNKSIVGFAYEGAVAGNVFAYNYVHNLWWSNEGGVWTFRYGTLAHAAHPMMNLIEGDYVEGRYGTDNAFGSNSHWTALRSAYRMRDRRPRSRSSYSFADEVILQKYAYFHSFVGCIIGTSGLDQYFNYNGDAMQYEKPPIMILQTGYSYGSAALDGTGHDTNVNETLLWWGNYCSVTNNSSTNGGMMWIPRNVSDTNDVTIPDSYFLTEPPIWWDTNRFRWPPYNPFELDANGVHTNAFATNIPAGYRSTLTRTNFFNFAIPRRIQHRK